MTKTILALSLLFSLPLFAASSSADYTLNMHVSQSRVSTGTVNAQELCATIDGNKYELESVTRLPKGIIALGDYKARLVKDQQKPTHEFNRTYELLFPNGTTRQFDVTGQVE